MGGRAVECTGLENRQSRKRLVGSNPTPSVAARCVRKPRLLADLGEQSGDEILKSPAKLVFEGQ